MMLYFNTMLQVDYHPTVMLLPWTQGVKTAINSHVRAHDIQGQTCTHTNFFFSFGVLFIKKGDTSCESEMHGKNPSNQKIQFTNCFLLAGQFHWSHWSSSSCTAEMLVSP